VGHNKRYEDYYDRRYEQRQRSVEPIEEHAHYSTVARDWKPPWPPIRTGDGEWMIMRDSNREPVAVVRALHLGPRDELFYRVVTWAPTSAGRKLIGYFGSVEDADRSILFGGGVAPLEAISAEELRVRSRSQQSGD